MGRLRDIILNFDLGVESKDKWIVFGIFAAYFLVGYVVEGTTRLFWMHWIGAYIIALIIFFVSKKYYSDKGYKNALSFMFPKEIWSHRSTINDCIIAVINSFLARFAYLVISVGPIAAAGAIGYFLAEFLDLSQTEAAPTWGVIAMFTVVTLLASDFCYYWAHRFAHTFPVWWEFHKTHHSAEVMTPITLLRYHPLDDLIYAIFRHVGSSVTAGFFLFMYPSIEGAATILSTNVVVFAFNILGSNLRHSHIWLSYGPHLSYILISPAMHHIHHSEDEKHWDRNFGAIFSIWDWMFGTIYVPKEREEITFGIGEPAEEFNTVPKLYLGPFIRAYSLLKKTDSKADISTPR
jgi:sterol desaturase/sphingolipid hydroxylase (fatty acid hydroxylase superfamily)